MHDFNIVIQGALSFIHSLVRFSPDDVVLVQLRDAMWT